MNSLDFQEKIKYTFRDRSLLEKALTHSSYIKEKSERSKKNNERLEFLGDAFLDAIISTELYERMQNVEEGVLTKVRAKIVCEKSLAEISEKLCIGEYMRMGRGEEHAGGRHRESIIADALEAVIGAIFLDAGYEVLRQIVLEIFEPTIKLALEGRIFTDYKTEIQERLQAMGKTDICYRTTDAKGPDHDKTFFISLECDGREIGAGVGKSKKEAEQAAAKHALERGLEICTSKE
ncbi:MAG: ribonuclease III [Clostridia bacterium]|nr:ribonuclease III [Clostridia bacterium]